MIFSLRRQFGLFIAAVMVMTMVPLVAFVAPADAAMNRTISVTITDLNCASTGCGGDTVDWFARVFMNGGPANPHEQFGPEDTEHIRPGWVFTKEIPMTQQTMPVAIQTWDDDPSSDDLVDSTKQGGDKTLDFTVNLANNTVTGDFGPDGSGGIGTEICTFGNGDDSDGAAFICYKVGTGDRDGDGLQDTWETSGIDFDGDTMIDLPLNAAPFNANPDRKDIFMEIDYMACSAAGCAPGDVHSHRPAPGALQDVVDAFAAAPVTNPVGPTGITLHAMEDEAIPEVTQVLFLSNGPGVVGIGTTDDFNDIKNGRPTTTCNRDGYFGANTLAERNGPNCVPFLAAKRAVFQYVVFGHDYTEAPGSSGISELDPRGGNDLMVTLGTFGAAAGAIAAVGGQRAADASTLMHELGHNLALQHGGNEPNNCKPNYLSLMSYSFQFTNFDPARPMDYSRSALPMLNETALPAAGGVGGPAGRNTIYGIGGNVQPPAPANGPINWGPGGTTGDIDWITAINPGCQNASPGDTTMTGFDDWQNLVYDHTFSPQFADGATRSGPIELTGDQVVAATPTADLNAAKIADKATAQPGDTINYTVTTGNAGPGKGYTVKVTDTLPDGNVQERTVGELAYNTTNTQAFSHTVSCAAADGATLTNQATVSGTNVALVGDSNQSNNTATASTVVQAPKVDLTKASSGSANAGTPITYTLTYSNTGAATATDVVVTDTLPADVYYSTALDTGTGPDPTTVLRNPDGTTTLIWNVGNVASSSGPFNISYTARPSLLVLGGSTVQNTANVSFLNTNGCAYSAPAATTTTSVTAPPPTGVTKGLGYWRNHPAEWTPEILARIQATEQRWDGADGSAPDGVLSPAEVQAVMAPPGGFPRVTHWHVLAGYFNLATGGINAASTTKTGTAKKLGITNVRGVGLYSKATLSLPYNNSTKDRYNDTKNLWHGIHGD